MENWETETRDWHFDFPLFPRGLICWRRCARGVHYLAGSGWRRFPVKNDTNTQPCYELRREKLVPEWSTVTSLCSTRFHFSVLRSEWIQHMYN